MPHRQFKHNDGRIWDVWDVHPSSVERSLEEADRNDRTAPSTRRRSGSGFALPRELRGGWLAFQSDDDARRLAPIPESWERLSDRELTGLAEQAARVPRRGGTSARKDTRETYRP